MSARFESSSTGPVALENDLAHQVERIVHSETFRGSETLRKLLEYLSGRSKEGAPGSIKAKEIAAVVFGRAHDFDPQNDSIVRVHTGRLRAKLAEYYASEGIEDDLIVTIPRGSYLLSVHHRACAPTAEPALDVIAEPAHWDAVAQHSRPFVPRLWYALGVIVAVVCTWIVARSTAPAARPVRATPALATFWRGFLANEDRALIVYSNMRVRSVDSDRELLLPSNGEVLGVSRIAVFFTSLGKPVQPRRGALLAWDEAKEADLVFVGGPLAETPLRAVPTLHDFAFKQDPAGGPGVIENLRPRNGEPAAFRGAPHPQQFDYAVVALKAGFSPTHRSVTLAGISGYGTQGAAEFVTREERVQELLSHLSIGNHGTMPPFEAVIRFNVQGGVALQPEIVSVHRFN